MTDLRKLAAEGCPHCGGVDGFTIKGEFVMVPCPECARVAALLKRVEGDAVRRICDAVGHFYPLDSNGEPEDTQARDEITYFYPQHFEGVEHG